MIDHGTVAGIATQLAKKYAKVGIKSITTNPAGTAIRFIMTDDTYYDVPLSGIPFMLKPDYDTNADGVVNAADKVGGLTKDQLLDRKNHTGLDDWGSIKVDPTMMDVEDGWFSGFHGTTLKELLIWIDKNAHIYQELILEDFEEPGGVGSWRIVPKKGTRELDFERINRPGGPFEHVTTLGSVKTDTFELLEEYGRVQYHHTLGGATIAAKLGDGILQYGDPNQTGLFFCSTQVPLHLIMDNEFTTDHRKDSYRVRSLSTGAKPVTRGPAQSIKFRFTLDELDLPEYQPGEKWCFFKTYRFFNTEPVENAGVFVRSVHSDDHVSTYYQVDTPDGILYGKGTGFSVDMPIGQKFIDRPWIRPQLLHPDCKAWEIEILLNREHDFWGEEIDGKFVPCFELDYVPAWGNQFLTWGNVTNDPYLEEPNWIPSSKALGDVRKMISSAVSGMTYMGGITLTQFLKMTSGKLGCVYKLSEDTVVNGQTLKVGSQLVIKNTWTGRPIESTDYDVFPAADPGATKACLFITDVQALEPAGAVANLVRQSAPNSGAVQSVSTNATKLKVTVEWDRTWEAYQGSSTVNKNTVINVLRQGGGTFKGDVVVSAPFPQLLAEMGTSSYTVPVTVEPTPAITKATIGTTYPTVPGFPAEYQTACHTGDTMKLLVEYTHPIKTIRILEGPISGVQDINVQHSALTADVFWTITKATPTLTSKKLKIQVQSRGGAWSAPFETSNTLDVDDTKPSMVLGVVDYPPSQTAIKSSEQVTFNYTMSECDVLSLVMYASWAEMPTVGMTQTVVIAQSGRVEVETGDVKMQGLRKSNGTSELFVLYPKIAASAPKLLTNTVIRVRNGETKTIPCEINQTATVLTASLKDANTGTLIPDPVITTKTWNPQIQGTDLDIRSSIMRELLLDVVGEAGLTATLSRHYELRGFTPRDVQVTYPTTFVTIPELTSVNEAVVKGWIQCVPPYEICTKRTPSPVLVSDYALTTQNITLAKLSTLAAFGYSATQNIKITIEEK